MLDRPAPRHAARLRCEALEDRLTPASGALSGTGTDLGRVLPTELFAEFAGPVAVAVGDVTGDGTGDIVAVAPVNGHVKVLDGRTGGEVRSFLAYPGFTGPVSVAAGDVNLDGTVDIVTAAAKDGHVKVFDGRTGDVRQSFLAYPGNAGAVAVDIGQPTTGFVNSNFFALTTAPGPIVTRAASGHVKAFDGRTGTATGSVVAFPGYAGSVRVASGDLNFDGFPDLAVGAGQDGHVKVYDGRTGAELWSVLAYPGNAAPIELTIGSEILTTRAANDHVKWFNVAGQVEFGSFFDADRNGRPDPGTETTTVAVPGPEPVPTTR